ncbi:hypothetical protein, partial [Pseudomonas syringae]|uniref:hypothetical protein n=1 Tax=Pseudomonas syringae TaxID=317 RepID=UPI001C3F1A2D
HGDPDIKGNCVRLNYADTIDLNAGVRKVCSPAPYIEMASTCNHRVFRPGLIASIRHGEPALTANEPASSHFDLQSSATDQD